MKKTFGLKLIGLALIAPSAAFAHAGDHSVGLAQNIAHALSQPDHLFAMLGVIALAYVALRFVKG